MITLSELEKMIDSFTNDIYDAVRSEDFSIIYDFAVQNGLSLEIKNKITVEGLIKPYLKFRQKNVKPAEFCDITVTIGTYKYIMPALYFSYEDKYTYLNKKVYMSLKNVLQLERLLNKISHDSPIKNEKSSVREKNIPLYDQTEDLFLMTEDDIIDS